MKKIILFVFVSLLYTASYTQVVLNTDQLRTDSLTLNKTDWVSEFSKDGTMADNSDRKVATQKALVTYVTAQIAAITAGTTDTAEVIRLIAAYLDTVNIQFTATYDALGDTIITYFNKNWGYTFSFKTQLLDSIAEHTDSLQAHNVRILVLKDSLFAHNVRLLALETLSHTHSNKATLDAITAPFTTAQSTRLEGVNDTILVIIKLTEDTLTAVEVKTGYIFPITRTLSGCNLYRAEAFSPDNGNGVAAIKVYRNRGGVVTTVTSTGADIDGLATISGTYDDVLISDYYDFGLVEAGASTYTIGVDICLTFIRP